MIFGATALGVVLSTPAFGQEAADSATGDIVVTARRVEERLQDVPISITVLNQAEIANRNITTASELGTYTPSLTINARFGPDKASFAIRGFSQIRHDLADGRRLFRRRRGAARQPGHDRRKWSRSGHVLRPAERAGAEGIRFSALCSTIPRSA
jgi:outer membrane receptor protein involved in Fe transport